MAAAQFAAMGPRPTVKTENFDMEAFFDFNNGTTQPSPATASSSKADMTPQTASQDWNSVSPFDMSEERQHYNGPSHDYNQYKQQVGLPVGSMANMPQSNGMFDANGSGIGDMGFDGGFAGWSSGIDVDAEMGMDFNNPGSSMPAMFFPAPTNDGNSDFVNPNNVGGQEEPTSNVGRLWPGMHSQHAQQAAMQKAAQTQAMQQRQMKLQAQHAQYRQVGKGNQSQGSPSQPSQGQGKRASHVSEPHVEESISRLLNQMRQNSTVSNGDDDDDSQSGGLLPHIARMKKDEEDMDEDERLLASDEGKKLSSKERRQLRNKVSARAFRSRRKEYISQLEGEVAIKTQEATSLRQENTALLQENERYRGLIETLLRHPAFTPFINDISKDPAVLGMPQGQSHQAQQQQQQQQQPITPSQQPSQPQQQQQQHQAPQQGDVKPDFLNFDASQLQIPGQQQEHQQTVGLAMIPENDFSKLNINGFHQSMNFNNFSTVNAYAITELPIGPDPADLLIDNPTQLRLYADSTSNRTCATPTTNCDMTVLLAKLDGAARTLEGGPF